MGRRKASDTVEVHEGVYLKRNDEGSAWQCYFRLDGRQFRKSTKVRDLADAKLTALRWFSEAKQAADLGKSVERVSFKKLVRTYLEYIEGQGKYAYHRDTIERHFGPFFGQFNDISKIDQSHLQDYLVHRRSKGAVLPQTLNRENTVLRQTFAFAERRGWLLGPIEVEHVSERLTKHRRRHFTAQEYVNLCHVAQKRIKELEGISMRKRAYQQRQLLFDYIKFLANTGVRIDEAKTIIWRNVDLDTKTILIERAGKTKSTRTIFVRITGREALSRIKARREDYLAQRGQTLNMNERVFSTVEGRPVNSFKKGFNALLTAAGFEYESVRDRHTLTSLRHSYATFSLTTTRAKRASMRSLSIQMGTSERMIHRHYGHDEIHHYEDELAGV